MQSILAEFPHHTTVAALMRLAEDGTSLDDLVACAEIKLRWREEDTFWLRRNRSGRIAPDIRQRHALSWRATAWLLEILGADASRRIEDDLLDEWLTLRAPTHASRVELGWWSYAAFLSNDVTRRSAWRTPPAEWGLPEEELPGRPPPHVPFWADPMDRTKMRGAPLPPMDADAWSRPMPKTSKATALDEEDDDAG